MFPDCVFVGDIVTLHILYMWGDGASRGILQCLVLVFERGNCLVSVWWPGAHSECICQYIFLNMFVVGAFIPALYCTS
jgi:hypothetical protein